MASAHAARSIWNKVSSIPKAYPFYFGVVFSGFKTSFSDLIVQKVVEQKETIDWKRNGAFAAFGFCYLGGIQYAIYVKFFGRIFPGARAFTAKPFAEKIKDIKGIRDVFSQTFIDQCVHHPLMYFPTFYCVRELCMQPNPDFGRCLGQYRANMSEDLLALWKIWFPATFVNFFFMPFHLRIPVTAAVSLIWTMVLSSMRGGDIAHGEEMAGGAVTGATLTLLEEDLHGLFTEPVQLQKHRDHIMISASGKDKPGWVALISRVVADSGGNVTHSKMVRLGEEFIILMHVSVPPEEQRELVKAVKKNPKLKDLNVQCNSIARRGTGTYEPAVMGVRIKCVGADKPGMLASISEAITASGLSVENITTELRRGKHDGLDFVVEADCVTTKFMDRDHVEEIVKDLSSLKTELELDTADVRIQRLVKPK